MYESKIFVGLRNHYDWREDTRDYAQTLATFDLSSMAHDFRDIFDKDIDFDMYHEDKITLIYGDCYGKMCKYTDIDTMMNYLEKQIASGENYRRMVVFYSFVKGLKDTIHAWERISDDGLSWSKLVFVHYGY